jgi:hypothetical protein
MRTPCRYVKEKADRDASLAYQNQSIVSTQPCDPCNNIYAPPWSLQVIGILFSVDPLNKAAPNPELQKVIDAVAQVKYANTEADIARMCRSGISPSPTNVAPLPDHSLTQPHPIPPQSPWILPS